MFPTIFLFVSTENELPESLTRSKTVPSLGRPKLTRKLSTVNEGERLRLAKEMVDKAIKVSSSEVVVCRLPNILATCNMHFRDRPA